MASAIVIATGAALFSEEELQHVAGLSIGKDFVEVTCGCTSRKYGDSIGRLRVFGSGNLEIKCECIQGCSQGQLDIFFDT